MSDLGLFEESTTRPEDWTNQQAAEKAVADELAYREWNLARWSVGLTALVGLGAIAGAAISAGKVRR